MQVICNSRHEYRMNNFVNIQGNNIKYVSDVQDWILGDDSGHEEATCYTYSYICSDEKKDNRPVLFAFNGGPGASCSQLHLGILGPTRIDFPDPEIQDPLDIYDLIPNESSPLDVCDIVMIDPPGTGYARIIDEDAAEKYFSVDGDAVAISLVIEAWLLKYGRLNSKVFIMGESYGTVRTPQVVSNLMGGPTCGVLRDLAIPVAGTLTIGNICLDQTDILETDAELPEESVINLPVYAATNWYHNLSRDKTLNRAFVEDSYKFAINEYLPALERQEDLDETEKRELVKKLSYYTGINTKFFEENDLRLTAKQFEIMCCADSNVDIGMYDSRYTFAHSIFSETLDPVADDAAMAVYMPSFTRVMNGAKRTELGIPAGQRYDQINFAVNGKWKYSSARSPIQCYAAAMRRNPRFRIFFGSGVYDLCTVFPYIRLLLSREKLDSSRITVKEYESGHVLYMGTSNAMAFGDDIRSFITEVNDQEV